MAKKQPKQQMNYPAELKKLREGGPERVYMLYGPEDYLRDSFLAELRGLCVEEGTEAFNYHRVIAAKPDMGAIREAVEAMPFMAERTLTEVRDFDVNKTAAYDADALKAILADVPEWATLAFVFPAEYAPDNRLTAVKAIKSAGAALEFTPQPDAALARWIARHARELGKDIDGPTASYLAWVCGGRMSTINEELLKVAGAAKGGDITRADVDATAKKAPETNVFDFTNALGEKRFDRAAALLADLLADAGEDPVRLVSLLGSQFQKLYIARVAREYKRPDSYITECLPEMAHNSYGVMMLKKNSANFTLEQLANAVCLCVECDAAMKTGDKLKSTTEKKNNDIMKDLVLRLAMDKA